MSLRDFWTNVRMGADFLLPVVIADSPRIDARQIESQLRRSTIWLTPKSVEGFDEADFDFLADRERKRLSRCVDEFLAVARQVPPNEPATEDQVNAALPPFLCVLDIVDPTRYGDLDALILGKRVERELEARLPEWVRQLQFETGPDATADPAVWIWVEMDDAAARQDVFSRHTRQLRDTIAACVRRLEVPHWPYIRFQRASERPEAGIEEAR